MYSIFILRRAQAAIRKLPDGPQGKVRAAIAALALVPRPPGCTKLVGHDAWRLRVGVYRVIYEIDDGVRIVTIIDTGHRRDVYR